MLTGFIGTGWSNCEFRTYTFDDTSASAVERAAIVETEESILRRFPDGTHRKLTSAAQCELRSLAEKSWAADGYIVVSEADHVHNDAVGRCGDESEGLQPGEDRTVHVAA